MVYAFFDFDGTVTKWDSFLDFILYSVGPVKFALGLFKITPDFLRFATKKITNWEFKEVVLTTFFAGCEVKEFDRIGLEYAQKRLPKIIKQSALDRIRFHKQEGHKVVIVTASMPGWIKGWCDSLGLELIATQLEVVSGNITGKLEGKNCHGPEKVRRIRERFDIQPTDYIYAYGDTGGDTQMLEMANEKFYKYFK